MSVLVSLPPATLASSTLADALENCRLAFTRHAAMPDNPETWTRFLQARREAASAIVSLAGCGDNPEEAKAIIALQRMIAASGAYDAGPAPEDLALVDQFSQSGPLGLLGAMLLVSPDQWPLPPSPQPVPPVYWNVYTAWLFYTPQGVGAAARAAI